MTKYTQKAILIISDTDSNCGNIPLVHGVYRSELDANRAFDSCGDLPDDLLKNIRKIPAIIEFEA